MTGHIKLLRMMVLVSNRKIEFGIDRFAPKLNSVLVRTRRVFAKTVTYYTLSISYN